MNKAKLENKIYLASLTLVVLTLLVRCIAQPAPTLHEEWLVLNVPEVNCLTWNEARTKYSIEGKVLASYMVRQEDCQ